jgi:DNA invertase Pin-like site-specific DNA recombinase
VNSEKCAQLYNSGMSLEAVAKEMRIAKSSVRRKLQWLGISLRPGTQSHEGRLAKKQRSLAGHAPYGYLFIRGRLVEHPQEIEIVHRILDLRKSGASFVSIAKTLNADGVRNRKGGPWWHPLICGDCEKGKIETSFATLDETRWQR